VGPSYRLLELALIRAHRAGQFGAPDDTAVEPRARLPTAAEVGRSVLRLYRERPVALVGSALLVQLVSLPLALPAGLAVSEAEAIHRPAVMASIREVLGSGVPFGDLAATALLLATEGVFRAYVPALGIAVGTALATMVAIAAVVGRTRPNAIASVSLVAAGVIIVLAVVAAYRAIWHAALDRAGVDETAFLALAALGLVLALVSLVLGTWLSVRWSFAPVAIGRGAGLRSALEESTALVLGRWWALSGLLLLAILAAALAFAPIGLILGWLPAGHPEGIAAAHVAQALVAPIVPAAVTLIHARLRRDG
jgi:hypothetical protein